MRKMKKMLLVILHVLTILYVPTMAFATSARDEKIINESSKYFDFKGNVENLISTREFGQTTKNYTYWRSEKIYVTRTPGSTGVTATVFNSGSHYVDICIFNADTDEIVGSTKTVSPNTVDTLSWENSSMHDKGKASNIYVFLTMYAKYINSLKITITY